jgi:hypothetical protein
MKVSKFNFFLIIVLVLISFFVNAQNNQSITVFKDSIIELKNVKLYLFEDRAHIYLTDNTKNVTFQFFDKKFKNISSITFNGKGFGCFNNMSVGLTREEIHEIYMIFEDKKKLIYPIK